VPGKIQECFLVIVNACSLSEKIQGLPCVSAFNIKNRTSLSHLQLVLELFKVGKPKLFSVSHFVVFPLLWGALAAFWAQIPTASHILCIFNSKCGS
jgi:hypothetical protein